MCCQRQNPVEKAVSQLEEELVEVFLGVPVTGSAEFDEQIVLKFCHAENVMVVLAGQTQEQSSTNHRDPCLLFQWRKCFRVHILDQPQRTGIMKVSIVTVAAEQLVEVFTKVFPSTEFNSRFVNQTIETIF